MRSCSSSYYSESMEDLLDLWRRFETGEKISSDKFDVMLSQKATQLKKEYGIRYDPSEVIPTDGNLWESAFNAAIDLLTTVGVFCYDTSTRIKFEEEEITEKIKRAPSKVFIGEGKERREYRSRNFEDSKPPLIGGGPCGCPVSEELFTKVLSSYAKEEIDVLSSGMLMSKRAEIKKGTPEEVATVTREVSLLREVLEDVEKPGLGIVGPSSGITATALNASLSQKGMRPSDVHITVLLNELKVNSDILNRIYYLLYNEVVLEVGQCPLVGYSGEAEETAIISVSEILLDYLLGGICCGFSPTSIYSSLSTERKTLWVTAATLLAIKKHIKPLVGNWIWAGAGPCTEMVCYEIAVQTMLDAVCGCDMVISAGCTAGSRVNYYTGMEARIAREAVKLAKRLNLWKANEVLNELMKAYEDNISNRKIPTGKSFEECYSLETLTPSEEYVKIWESVKERILEIL